METQIQMLAFSIILAGAPFQLLFACDCTIYPFTPDPPCPKVCGAHILNHSSKRSLKSVLGLSTAVTKKIDDLRGIGNSALSLDDYQKVLSPSENKILTQKLQNLDSTKLKLLSGSDTYQ
jgi:hypothetical protein